MTDTVECGAPGDQAAHVVSGLFRRDSLYVVLWALQVAGAALVTPFATRLMGPSQFGLLALANSTMQVVFTVLGLGLWLAVPRVHPRPDGGPAARRLLTLGLLAATAGGILTGLAGSLGARALGLPTMSDTLELSVAWAATSSATTVCVVLLRCRDDLRRFAAVNLVQSVGAEVASLVLLVAVARTATAFVLGQLIAQVVALGLGLAWGRPAPLRREHLGQVRESLVVCLPMVLFSLSSILLTLSDRFIVARALGTAEVARYQIAANIGTIPVLLLTFLSSAWIPRLFAIQDTRSRGAVHALSRDLLWRVLAPVTVGMAAGSPFVLLVWAPTSFRPDRLVLVTTVLALSALPASGVQSLTRALFLVDDTAFVAVGGMVGAVLVIALDVVLVPHLHLIGAAAVAVATQGTLYLIFKARCRRLSPIPRPGTAVRIQLAAATVLAVAIARLPVSGAPLALRGALAVAAGGWLLLAMTRAARRPVMPPAAAGDVASSAGQRRDRLPSGSSIGWRPSRFARRAARR